MEKEYNWWDDPKNEEEIRRIAWWTHVENKTNIELPVSIVEETKGWTICGNEETEKLIGDLAQVASGKTKEEAIANFFLMMRIVHDYEAHCARRYERWVPFIKGDWSSRGGKWFTIFGINVYFRYGKDMQGGWYIPFTKLNISIQNRWKGYEKWRKKTKSNKV
jgi:hypothetical protein